MAASPFAFGSCYSLEVVDTLRSRPSPYAVTVDKIPGLDRYQAFVWLTQQEQVWGLGGVYGNGDTEELALKELCRHLRLRDGRVVPVV